MIRKTIKGGDFKSQMVGELVFDQVPEEGSFNPVTSDAVAKAIDKAKDDMQEKIDEVTLDPSAVALGNVHLLDEVTEFHADGCILVDSETNGPRKMSKDMLLQLTAQNALAGNVAPSFIPNSTTTIAGQPYIYNGSLYVARENGYSGSWDANKFFAASMSDLFLILKNNDLNIFNFLYSESVNIFVKSSPVHGHYDQYGTFVQNASYRVTEPILLRPNTTYKLPFSSSLGGNDYVFILKADGSFDRTIRGSVSGGFLTFTSPLNEWVMASFNMGSNYDESNFMVCEASQYPGSFVKGGGYQLHLENAPEELKTIVSVSPNLFDESVTTGYLANTTIDSGVYGTTPNYYVSQPILVKGGVTYKATHKASFGGNFKYAVLDDEYNLVSTPSGTNDGGDTNYIVFTPASDCYIRLSVGTGTSWAIANAGFILAEYDKFPVEYISYGRKIADDIGLGKKQEQEVVDIADKHAFKGKVLAVNGDSICKGENAGGGYGQIIAEMFGMSLQNRGTNGATITAGTTDGSGNNRRWICRDIQYMADNADYVLIEGGVNDASLGVTMGDISEGYAATLDDETFAGAFESVVRDLLTKYPGKKVGYIAVHKMTSRYRSDGPETNYYWTAKKICEKWGMPFLDLNVSVPAFGFFSTDTPIGALRTTYTKSGDGWHPTEDGYKKYYVDKIVEFMHSL